MSGVTHRSDHGELKRRLAHHIGSDPSRYAADIGTERHKRLLDEEITLICDRLGLEFLDDEAKQQRMDAIMLKLGRDHRTGAQAWDTSDLVAVVRALHPDNDRDDIATDGGTADLEGLSTHDLVGKALAEHDDQDATDGIPTGDVVDWVVSRTELVRADVHDAIEWLHDRGHVYEPRPDFLRRTEADSERWLAVAWHEALVEAHAEAGDLDPRYLVDRYGAETPDEVDELVGQGVKEVIRGDNDRLTLDDLDAAEEKLKESGYEVVTDGGERR